MTSFFVPHLELRWLTLTQIGPWRSPEWAVRAGMLWGLGMPCPPCSWCAVPRGCCCCCACTTSSRCHHTCPCCRRCCYCLQCYCCCCSFSRTFHCDSVDRTGETLYIKCSLSALKERTRVVLAHAAGGTFLKLKLLGKDFFIVFLSFFQQYRQYVSRRHIGGGGCGCKAEACSG